MTRQFNHQGGCAELVCIDVFKEEVAVALDQQFWFISNVMYRVVLMQQNSFSLVLVLVLRMDIILTVICSNTVLLFTTVLVNITSSIYCLQWFQLYSITPSSYLSLTIALVVHSHYVVLLSPSIIVLAFYQFSIVSVQFCYTKTKPNYY